MLCWNVTGTVMADCKFCQGKQYCFQCNTQYLFSDKSGCTTNCITDPG